MKKQMDEYWSEKRVLVTGHTGFVGAWLCAVLKERGADVTGFSLREESGSLYEKIRDGLAINSVYGDLRETDAITRCVEETKPEVIFHLAAFGFVKECMDDPERAYTTNVLGTLHLLQAVQKSGISATIVVASSDKVYMNDGVNAHLFREDDPLGADDPYSASKACEDMLARSFFASYLKDTGASMCVVRPSNILGGGDHLTTRLIPGMFAAIREGKTPQIRNPFSVRPWQDILDMTDAYLTLAEKAKSGNCAVYNVGPEPEGIRTVGEIAEVVLSLYGREGVPRWKGDKAETADTGSGQGTVEKAQLGLSIEKIRTETGWRPRKTIELILQGIYDFYENDDGVDTYTLCKEQIREYERLTGER